MKYISALFVFFTLIFMTAMAFAQATDPSVPVPQAPVVEFFGWLVRLVFIVVSGAVMWAVVKAKNFFEEKTKIDIPKQYEDMLFGFATRGVALAEEKAHRIAKNSGEKLSGNQKVDVAMDFVRDLAKQYGLDKAAEEKVKNYIDAALGLERMK